VNVYYATVDPGERNTSHAMMLELVGSDVDVLDVGCASGYMAEALGKRGCRVSGIEFDPVEAEKARPFLQEIVVADLNTADLGKQFKTASFDVIMFGDVLEHLLDPVGVLQSSLTLLRAGGTVIISIPNVAHGSLRLALLQGAWNYTPTGLLDQTHVRFFTRATLHKMLAEAGLRVVELRCTVADALGTEVSINTDALPSEIIQWVRDQPAADAYQFVLAAQVSDSAASSELPEGRPAVELAKVRDVHTEIAELQVDVAKLTQEIGTKDRDIIDLRRRVLTNRDFAIGTEAQIARLRSELAHARQEGAAHKAEHDAFVSRLRQHRARSAIAVALGPRGWHLLTAPVRIALRVIRSPR
jgi:2-polyprenyl-3-methyl-5-hydroxy-6-metoxy-1,4-benzoquinol methylase